jgi:hypothetical protein
VIVNVPVQYYQSVIAIETAVTGVLLFQIRFFDSDADAPGKSASDPRVRVLMLILLRVLPPLRRDAETHQRDPHFWITVLGLILYAAIVALIVSID